MWQGPRVLPPSTAAVPARRARSERSRAALLAAARTAFAAGGWSRTRVADVCRIADVGHGTFYGHFANKADALEALVRAHAADLYQLLEADWSGADPRDAVSRVIEGFVACSDRDADVRATWLEAAPSEPALAALVDEVRGHFVARIRDSLAAAVAAGRARPGLDVDVAATALAAMVEHTAAIAQRGQLGVDADRLTAALTDLWVSAVYGG